MQIPIATLHLFPILDQKLIELLKSLSEHEWNKPTRAKLWTVKDIAAHLLDGNLRGLSISRDQFLGEKAQDVNSYQDLVTFLNKLNADWVKAAKRLSPTVLIDLLESTGWQYTEHLASLDPFAPSIFPVSWAGESESSNWFHIAREYTEKWHHQQQIREAVEQKGILTQELYYPALQAFMKALPHHWQEVRAVKGTSVKIKVTGEVTGEWFLTSNGQKWELTADKPITQTSVTMDAETSWKLLTKGLSGAEAADLVNITGEISLGSPIFKMTAVMA